MPSIEELNTEYAMLMNSAKSFSTAPGQLNYQEHLKNIESFLQKLENYPDTAQINALVNRCDNDNRTLLHYLSINNRAATEGSILLNQQLNLSERLVNQFKADPNFKDKDGHTPIYYRPELSFTLRNSKPDAPSADARARSNAFSKPTSPNQTPVSDAKSSSSETKTTNSQQSSNPRTVFSSTFKILHNALKVPINKTIKANNKPAQLFSKIGGKLSAWRNTIDRSLHSDKTPKEVNASSQTPQHSEQKPTTTLRTKAELESVLLQLDKYENKENLSLRSLFSSDKPLLQEMAYKHCKIQYDVENFLFLRDYLALPKVEFEKENFDALYNKYINEKTFENGAPKDLEHVTFLNLSGSLKKELDAIFNAETFSPESAMATLDKTATFIYNEFKKNHGIDSLKSTIEKEFSTVIQAEKSSPTSNFRP